MRGWHDNVPQRREWQVETAKQKMKAFNRPQTIEQ